MENKYYAQYKGWWEYTDGHRDEVRREQVRYITQSDLPEYEGYWLFPNGERIYYLNPGAFEGSTAAPSGTREVENVDVENNQLIKKFNDYMKNSTSIGKRNNSETK